jgi:hypothetical protein
MHPAIPQPLKLSIFDFPATEIIKLLQKCSKKKKEFSKVKPFDFRQTTRRYITEDGALQKLYLRPSYVGGVGHNIPALAPRPSMIYCASPFD